MTGLSVLLRPKIWVFRFLFIKFLPFQEGFDTKRQDLRPWWFSHKVPKFNRLWPWWQIWRRFLVPQLFWPFLNFGSKVLNKFAFIHCSLLIPIDFWRWYQYFFWAWWFPSWANCFHFTFGRVYQSIQLHLRGRVKFTWIFAGIHWPDWLRNLFIFKA